MFKRLFGPFCLIIRLVKKIEREFNLDSSYSTAQINTGPVLVQLKSCEKMEVVDRE